MMARKLRGMAAAAAVLVLASCGFTPEGDMARDFVKTKGAQAYDAGLENAEWFLCNAASVGSIRRRYGRDAQTVAAYNALCAPSVDIFGGQKP
jgi:hypothetical protein